MTPTTYRETLARLGLSQARFGRALGVDKMTPNRWAMGRSPIPHSVVILLRALDAGRLTVDDLERLAA